VAAIAKSRQRDGYVTIESGCSVLASVSLLRAPLSAWPANSITFRPIPPATRTRERKEKEKETRTKKQKREEEKRKKRTRRRATTKSEIVIRVAVRWWAASVQRGPV